MEKIRTVLFGVGAMGGLIARHLLQTEGFQIVGAIDQATEKAGKDLGEVLNLDKTVGVTVDQDAEAVLTRTTPHIVVHATSSHMKDVFNQLLKIVKHRANVVSTCEELSAPYYSEPQLAQELDILAKTEGVTVLGTGINPGFLMDTLVITLSAVCQEIEEIKVTRIMNAGTRRVPFQKKIGAGLEVNTFRERIKSRLIRGHIGLEQSISMIATALAWNLEKIEAGPVEPIIAPIPVESKAIKVKTDFVAGLKQTAKGYQNDNEVIVLDFQAYIGAEEEYDSISIKGVPNINQKISPCVHGDIGTVAMVTNSIPKVITARAGLLTMKDLPVPSAIIHNH